MVVHTALYDDILGQNRPSLFATPLAWAAADFTGQLLAHAGQTPPHHTALIVVSDDCSLSTIRELSRTATRGVVSPLRFAGASPSIVTGLPALEHGLRGPTLTLTMRPDRASGAVAALIEHWFARSAIAAVIAVAHHETDAGRQLFKGFIARGFDETVKQQVLQLCRLRD